jgi:arylsulfatase A-like enzyme
MPSYVQGFNIVHPPYGTNEYWFNRIDPANVTVPPLPALADMHPCDFQSSMLKGCTPSDADADAFDDPARRARIRRIYAAEVAEFDAMVGAYVAAVAAAGASDNTLFLIFADHGDMQLEHRSFYKMVAYEGSAHVPLLVSAPWLAASVVTQPVQLIDLYPTLLELAGAPPPPPGSVDGYSLAPFLAGAGTDPSRPPFAVSQFHGADIPASWFMLRHTDGWKYVVWGDGVTSGPAQLFNLTADPGELTNVAGAHPDVVAQLDAALRSVVDYPAVSADVAQYEVDMFKWWTGAHADWRAQLADPARRWHTAWAAHAKENLAAVEAWLAAPPPAALLPCRNATVWPPPKAAAAAGA